MYCLYQHGLLEPTSIINVTIFHSNASRAWRGWHRQRKPGADVSTTRLRGTFYDSYLDVLEASLVLSVTDGAVLLDDHSPATGAVTLVRASLPAVVLGEEGLAVGEHEEVLALGNAVDLAPSVEDKLVVVGDESNNVDTLGLELLELLDVGRKVVGGAARGESTRNGNDDDLLASPLLVGIIQLRDTADGRVLVEDRGPAIEHSSEPGLCIMTFEHTQT